MDTFNELGCFEYHHPNKIFPKDKGWKYAPLRYIFDIKSQYLWYKSHLVVGGHVVDASELTTYASTVKTLSVRILWVV